MCTEIWRKDNWKNSQLTIVSKNMINIEVSVLHQLYELVYLCHSITCNCHTWTLSCSYHKWLTLKNVICSLILMGLPYFKTKFRSPYKMMSKYPQSELMENWSDIYHISLVNLNSNLNANDIHHFNLLCHLLYFIS